MRIRNLFEEKHLVVHYADGAIGCYMTANKIDKALAGAYNGFALFANDDAEKRRHYEKGIEMDPMYSTYAMVNLRP